jgi:hypothetical protein
MPLSLPHATTTSQAQPPLHFIALQGLLSQTQQLEQAQDMKDKVQREKSISN